MHHLFMERDKEREYGYRTEISLIIAPYHAAFNGNEKCSFQVLQEEAHCRGNQQ